MPGRFTAPGGNLPAQIDHKIFLSTLEQQIDQPVERIALGNAAQIVSLR